MDLILNPDQKTRTPELAHLSPKFRTTPAGGHLAHIIKFSVNQAHMHDHLLENRVSNLEISGPKTRSYHSVHRGLEALGNDAVRKQYKSISSQEPNFDFQFGSCFMRTTSM
ncbi:hypothetical protein AVEN_71144-1 [Araneus ventricosus]|uniref:Uncharacterized protein n=1 Tax=Araneus ventricosus TaxID=182803 RepID=A0A4Y2T044_ARAVE|nr:hypothetical protein AVEN_205036-1 [Araneus ventricosus]GBN92901.1 hypothetical protein AVEN_71144-1 [Araneus ventricosus]